VPVDIAALRERIAQRSGVADKVRSLVLPDDAVPAGADAGSRWHPSRRAIAALGVVVVAVIVLTVAWVFSSRPQSLTVAADGAQAATIGPRGSAAPSPAALSSTSSSSSSTLSSSTASAANIGGDVVVDVEGKVRHPGLYHLRPGARVDDALRLAGGVKPGVSAVGLNRAAKLTDGQQIVVGLTPPAAGGAAAGGGGASGAGGGVAGSATPSTVNLNTADLAQLEQLPGVGPVLAQHILDWRSQHGGFARVDQLQDVSGIGPSKFAALKDAVTL
jgi:competence protein ComEA